MKQQKFWDKRIRLFCGPRSFYQRTTSGWFASWFRFYIDRIVRLKGPVDELLHAKTVDLQQEIYDRKIRDKIWRGLLGFCLKRDSVLALSGIPPDQRRQVQRFQSDVLAYLQSQAENIIYELPLSENYFWRVYLTGEYTPECCPRYLQESNFERLKGLTDRISFHTNSVSRFLQQSNRSFSHFVLLDHMDWLSNLRFQELEQEWQAIIDRAQPNAKLLWRSLGLKTDFVDRVRVRFEGQERSTVDLLDYNRELAEQLQKQERVNLYGCLKIATLRR